MADGRVERLLAVLEGFMRQLPGLTLHDARLIRSLRRPEDRDRFLAGLRKAGLPD